jgi:hypothetical protein
VERGDTRNPQAPINPIYPDVPFMTHRLMLRVRNLTALGGRLRFVFVLTVGVMSATGGVAQGVVRGKTVSIKAAPWTVVVWGLNYAGEHKYADCTGVIIDPLHVLTAGHCVMSGESAKQLPSSSFSIEAGVSNFRDPLASDAPQFRAVSAVRVMPGYIAENKLTHQNWIKAAGYDLAVLTLSRPLDLDRDDAKAASLPNAHTRGPSSRTTLVLAGIGSEERMPPLTTLAQDTDSANRKDDYENGTLNEIPKLALTHCSTRVLCVFAREGVCWGDMGAGLVEPGAHPTVIGILSQDPLVCYPEYDRYVSLTAPAVLRFVEASR